MPRLNNSKKQKQTDLTDIETDIKVNQYRTGDLIDRIVRLESKVNALEKRGFLYYIGFKK